MFVDTLHERNLYGCARIHVKFPAVILRAVEGTYTLWFTRLTTAHRLEGIPDDPIYWSYELMLISDLPPATDVPARLVDVVGVITSISDIALFQPSPWTQAMPVRYVFVSDLMYVLCPTSH